ncbi:MAG: hypothetical protein Q8K75_03625 [Chlamydiales bacterium]|nr:hypothetical protein [Chlamydiales bacterium]
MYKKILTMVAVGMVSTSLFAVNATNSTFPSDHGKPVANTNATDPLTKPGTFRQQEGSFPKNSAAFPRNTPKSEGMEKRNISGEDPSTKTPTMPQQESVYKQPSNLYPNTTANPTTVPQK